LKIQNYY